MFRSLPTAMHGPRDRSDHLARDLSAPSLTEHRRHPMPSLVYLKTIRRHSCEASYTYTCQRKRRPYATLFFLSAGRLAKSRLGPREGKAGGGDHMQRFPCVSIKANQYRVVVHMSSARVSTKSSISKLLLFFFSSIDMPAVNQVQYTLQL